MGRPKGSKNAGNQVQEPEKVTLVSVNEKEKFSDVFTSIPKDFIGVGDLMDASGLSYNTCLKLIHEIKAVSDSFGISGYVHRLDYFIFLSRRFEAVQMSEGGQV